MGPQDHVTCGIMDNGMWMCGAMIEQLCELLHGGLCAVGLLHG